MDSQLGAQLYLRHPQPRAAAVHAKYVRIIFLKQMPDNTNHHILLMPIFLLELIIMAIHLRVKYFCRWVQRKGGCVKSTGIRRIRRLIT